MNFLRALAKHFNRLSYYFIGFCFVFSIGCLLYGVFFLTPAFLFIIKDGLSENPQLMQLIGEEQGYDLWYSGEKTTLGNFRVTIHGICSGASLTVCGTYKDEVYTATDTVIVKCP